MTTIITDPALLHPCGSGQCNRRTTLGARYCCGPCAIAWEASPRYEPHSHGVGCDDRHTARGGTL